MGYCKDKLLTRLQELQIDFAQYEHPVVLTVEAQAKYVGHMKGALSKNLFLKDKKHRFYIVPALADTKVDLKVLSQRLGLGKGGLRMSTEDALGEMLQSLMIDVIWGLHMFCYEAKAPKASSGFQKEKSDSTVKCELVKLLWWPGKLVEEILEKTTSIVLSEVKEENMEKRRDQLGTMVSNSIRKQLSVGLKSILVTFNVQEHIIYRRLLCRDSSST